jgi:hypothetical protein
MIISKKVILVRYVAGIRGKRNVYKILVVNSEAKRLFSVSRCRWKENIKVDLTAAGWKNVR